MRPSMVGWVRSSARADEAIKNVATDMRRWIDFNGRPVSSRRRATLLTLEIQSNIHGARRVRQRA